MSSRDSVLARIIMIRRVIHEISLSVVTKQLWIKLSLLIRVWKLTNSLVVQIKVLLYMPHRHTLFLIRLWALINGLNWLMLTLEFTHILILRFIQNSFSLIVVVLVQWVQCIQWRLFNICPSWSLWSSCIYSSRRFCIF